MTGNEGRVGVVLAGGYSKRFGERDKALAEVDGTPMLAHVVTRLSEAVDTVVVNCRADQRDPFEDALVTVDTSLQFAIDSTPDQGPLAGLYNTFERIKNEYVAVVACDMPGVDPDFLEYLFEQATGRDGAVPELQDGHLQPVQAVYRTDAMRSVARKRLADERRSLHGALDSLDILVVSPETVSEQTTWGSFRDVNTTDELISFEKN